MKEERRLLSPPREEDSVSPPSTEETTFPTVPEVEGAESLPPSRPFPPKISTAAATRIKISLLPPPEAFVPVERVEEEDAGRCGCGAAGREPLVEDVFCGREAAAKGILP